MNGCIPQLGSPPPSPSKRPLRSPSVPSTATVSNGPSFLEEDEKIQKFPRVVLKRLTKEEIHAAVASKTNQGSSTSGEEYEVEDVVDIKKDKGRNLFLIKWKNWSKEYNSWETEESVQNCMALVRDCCVRTNSSYRLNLVQKAIQRISNLEDPDVATLAKLSGFTVPENGFVKKQEIVDMRKEVLRLSANRPAQMARIMKVFGSWVTFVDRVEDRQVLSKTIRAWEAYIQVASGTYKADSTKPLLRVENYVDTEPPPIGFVYIKDFLPGPGVVFPDDPKMGCQCENCYLDRKGCCPAFNDVRFAYTPNGTLTVPFGSPIFECNRLCKCSQDCPNRVVQRGCKIPLTIFRTTNGRGWGVRTEQRISKGAFVMEYLGQVITDEEAEKRGKQYDAQGMTYLFDLDYHLTEESVEQTTLYTVDAGTFGNVAHFVNHSCEPNMAVCMVWINNLDVRMPRLAFFANRDICIHEELTVDYKMSTSASETQPPKKNRVACLCGSEKCRGFLD